MIDVWEYNRKCLVAIINSLTGNDDIKDIDRELSLEPYRNVGIENIVKALRVSNMFISSNIIDVPDYRAFLKMFADSNLELENAEDLNSLLRSITRIGKTVSQTFGNLDIVKKIQVFADELKIKIVSPYNSDILKKLNDSEISEIIPLIITSQLLLPIFGETLNVIHGLKEVNQNTQYIITSWVMRRLYTNFDRIIKRLRVILFNDMTLIELDDYGEAMSTIDYELAKIMVTEFPLIRLKHN